jgi:hypothetical protein
MRRDSGREAPALAAEALRLRIDTFSNEDFRRSLRYASEPEPWNILATKVAPGLSVLRTVSSASSRKYIDEAWSAESMPVRLGAMSEMIRSNLLAAQPAESFSTTDPRR